MKYKIQLRKPAPAHSYKVYFDPESGRVSAITNKTLPDNEHFYETSVATVEEFLTGEKNLTKHRVIFDVKKQTYDLIHNDETIIVYANDLIHQIKTEIAAQITVKQDIKNHKWVISASDSVKKQMKTVQLRLEETLIFSATSYGNPNILYNHFFVNVKDLVNGECVAIPFKCQEEQNPEQVSIYTSRKFNKYTHEVINE